MKEQYRDFETATLPETIDLMHQVQEVTGSAIVVRPDHSLAGKVRAKVRPARPDYSFHIISFDPAKSRFLNHTIPHECGHLLRLWSAPTDARLIPISSAEQRAAAGRQLGSELLRLLGLGLRPEDVGTLLAIWQEGILMQLTSTPPDIHIEKWLYRDFPGLRNAQTEALQDTLRDYRQGLRPKVRRLTPPTIYRASVAMNYAFTKTVSDIQNDRQPLRPYQGMLETAVGERLYAITDSIGDDGHVGDRVTTDRWAHELGLSGWYRWVKMEEVQGGSYSMS